VVVLMASSRTSSPSLHDALPISVNENAPPVKAGRSFKAAEFVAARSGRGPGDVGGLEPLLRLTNLELHVLPLGERLEPLHRDRGEVDEDVLTVRLLNEAIALGVIEPLHLTSGHRTASYEGWSPAAVPPPLRERSYTTVFHDVKKNLVVAVGLSAS